MSNPADASIDPTAASCSPGRPAASLRSPARHRRLTLTAMALAVTVLAGCGGSTTDDAAAPATDSGVAPAIERPGSVAPLPTTTVFAPMTTIAGETIETPSGVVPTYPEGYSLYEPGKTVVAQALPGESVIDVYDTATSLRPSRSLTNPIRPGTPLVFVAEGKTPDRLHVQLPMRPNGSKGWIDITKVSLAAHGFRVDVSLSGFKITVREGSRVILEAPVGIGEDDVPSPDGTYYITELLQPPTKDSVYGTYAYGLSGFSEVLNEFNGGNGQVGIHGTNDPSSIGQKVSHGCIRLRNDDIERLVGVLPLGTPVHITA